MKTVTVRGIGPDLAIKLKETAKKEGKIVNQLLIEILKRHLGMQKEKKFTIIQHDMDHLFGKWSAEEFERIQGKIDSERKIDKELKS